MRFLAALLLAIVVAAMPALAQQDAEGDAGFLTRQLQNALSGAGREVRIEGFQGALSSTATIDRITFADREGVWLTVEDATMSWSRAALLRRAIRISTLAADRVVLSRLPAPDPDAPPDPGAGGFALPELPVSVEIGQLDVQRIDLGEPVLGQAATLTLGGSLALLSGTASADLRAERLDEPAGRFDLAAAFDRANDVLALRLSADEAQGGLISTLARIPGAPALDLDVTSEGPLSDFEARIRLAAGAAERLTGTVAVTRLAENGAAPGQPIDPGAGPFPWRVTADIAGDLGPLVAPPFRPFFGDRADLRLDAVRAPGGALTLDEITLRTRALYLDAAGALGPDGAPRALLLRGLLRDLRGGPIRLPIPGDDAVWLDSGLLRAEFDAAAGDGWRTFLLVEGLETAGLALGDLRLSGSGALTPGDGADGIAAFAGTIEAAASGIAARDPAIDRALGDRLTAAADLAWDSGAPLRLRSVTVAGADWRATLSGDLADPLAGGVFTGRATAGADDLARFSALAGRDLSGAAVARAGGEINLLGGAFDLDLAASARALGTGDPAIDRLIGGQPRLSAAVRRDAEGLSVEAFALDASGLAATGTGALTGTGRSVAVEGAATARLADLSALSGLAGRPLAGTAEAGVSGRATLDLSAFDLTATLDAANLATGDAAADRLIGGDLTARLSAARDGRAVTLRDLAIDAPGITATASGSATGSPDALTVTGTATARVADLAGLSALAGRPLAGAVTADLSGTAVIDATRLDPVATLTGDTFALDARIAATGLATGDPGLDRLLGGNSRIVIDAARADDALRVETLDIALPGLTASATGSVTGPPADALAQGQARLAIPDLAALGGLTGLDLGGRLDASAEGSAAIDGSRFDLTAAADARGLRTGTPADPVVAGDGRLRADLEKRGAALTVDSLALTLPGLTASASGSLSGAGGRLDLRARLANLGVLLPDFPGALSVAGTVGQRADGTLAVDLSGQGPSGIDATLAGTYDPDANRAELRARGAATLALADVLIGSRDIALRGPVRFDLGLNGPPTPDSLSGTIGVTGGSVALPAVPLRLDALDATVRLNGRAATIEAGAAVASGGRVDLGGSLRLDPAAGLPADLTVTLRDAVLRQRGLYDVTLAGAVGIDGPLARGAAISGRITIPRAEITVAPPPPGGGAIAEMSHRNENRPERETRRRAGLLDEAANGDRAGAAGGPGWTLALTITAPNRIFVRGRGLDAELGGTITVGGTLADPAFSGSFQLIRGRLNLLARRLDLREARISLLGTLDPEIYVLARSRSPNGVTAIVEIEGPATDPDIAFRSEPELPEDEVLAELFFGRPLDELSAFQIAQLAAAIAELSGRGGDGVFARLRAATGFDDIDVETDAEGTITARAGKYLTENIYTSIGVTGEGTTELRLNLDLSPSVTARGGVTSDSESTIGIFFERDY
jgi:translocation and assembly module TamB